MDIEATFSGSQIPLLDKHLDLQHFLLCLWSDILQLGSSFSIFGGETRFPRWVFWIFQFKWDFDDGEQTFYDFGLYDLGSFGINARAC